MLVVLLILNTSKSPEPTDHIISLSSIDREVFRLGHVGEEDDRAGYTSFVDGEFDVFLILDLFFNGFPIWFCSFLLLVLYYIITASSNWLKRTGGPICSNTGLRLLLVLLLG
ncbi:hypothetical protein BDA99DRAFT_530717 [Phascolomyces articulosus]|uniref:Uncharacterized protein n=1 Tax=Phascolomyces articulosus TaxID=60185 RepID=A0AAD5P727_9FUNG|nr:hypothetical protein BDA99DRAFT_530717 [Phascolomyces articulosus]